MEFITQVSNFLPPFVSFLLGAIGVACFFVILLKKEKSKKFNTILTIGYGIGALGFLPVLIKFMSI